jgi:hypothetical protein
MFVFDGGVSTRTRTVTDDLRGCTGRAAISPDRRYEVKELGEIEMVSMALATLDLVTHDDAQPAFPAVHLEGHTGLSYGESADHELLEPPDTGTESRLQQPPQRTHECRADGHLADAFRELLG